MPKHQSTTILHYSPEQICDMVADIESYPEFLPWCSNARILTETDEGCMAELMISYKGLNESYVSDVRISKPNSISVVMQRGPFKHLINEWTFSKHEDGTEVKFFLDFAFKSMIFEKMIGSFFAKATEKMTGAFKERAEFLYGKQ